MTSDPKSLNASPLTFTGADGSAVAAPLTPQALTLINSLDLNRDDDGSIPLTQSNLQKLAAANVVDFDSGAGMYTLNVTLLAQVTGSSSTFSFSPVADGLWSVSTAAADAASLLQTEPGVATQETSPSNALNMQVAAPADAQENPYLGGQGAKLAILMQDLFLIQAAITQFDNQSFLKTFTRAIDNVQAQVAVIDQKTAAQNQQLLGDIAAAKMSIMASVASIGVQTTALAAIGGLSILKSVLSSSNSESKWSKLVQYNLESFVGKESALGALFDKSTQNYINIQHSQSNIAANQSLSVAEQNEAEVQLQLSFIKTSLKEDLTEGSQTSEQTQKLLDLIEYLSRAKLERQQMLFKS